METNRITIIMPAYNSAKTLLKAAYSCLNQTTKNIELIVVDDCSTDSTRELMAELKMKYRENIKCIYLEQNQGPGGARNRAFEEATGDYILFVDSDDWIEPDACERLLTVVEGKDDIDEVVGNYDYIYENGESKLIEVFSSAQKYMGYQNEKTHKVLLMQSGLFWCKLYKKTFLERIFPDGVLFPEKVRFEDSAFNTLTTIQAGRIEKLDYCFYHYYQNPSSISRDLSGQLEKIDIAKFLMNTAVFDSYSDLILYKCAVLCGVALVDGILPLFNTHTDACLLKLNELCELTPMLIGGGIIVMFPSICVNSLK
jgi:glycosyltransferase EpsH